MLIHDDIFSWEGFGGAFRLAAGRCRLRIFDLAGDKHPKVAHLKPILVVVSDLPEETAALKQVSVRSCASHIATSVARRFNIDPHRMTYVEYHPPSSYGDRNQHVIPARFDMVDFTWFEDKALHPRWRPLAPPLLDVAAGLVAGTVDGSHQ
jgi:hypothetical protein